MNARGSGRKVAQLALLLLVATAFGLVNALAQYYGERPVPAPGWAEVSWPHLLRAWTFAGMYPAARFLCRRWPLTVPRRRSTFGAHLTGGALLVLLSLVLVSHQMPYRVSPRPSPTLVAGGAGIGERLSPFRRTVVLGWRYHLILYGLALAAAAGMEAARRSRVEAQRDGELRMRLASARLETLRAQLHPHFLFNTLNGILPLVEDDPKAAVRAVGELAALLRESLLDGTRFTDVSGELRFLERYLGLMKLRFGERLDYELRVAPEAARGAVPRLLLQPLVENAVQHGLGKRPAGGRVEVEARRSGDTLILEVRDDGAGLVDAPDRASGLGLANTRARLAALHGERFSFALDPRLGGGVVARIEMPFEAAT